MARGSSYVSLPRPAAAKLDATAAAVPPLEPAVTRSSAKGFSKTRRMELTVSYGEKAYPHVGLRQDDRARVTHTLHLERVPAAMYPASEGSLRRAMSTVRSCL